MSGFDIERLALPRCAILDGGMGSELDALGINNDPLWSARLLVTNVEAIKNVHLRFLEAGADIIETATYQASIQGFQKCLNLTEEEALKLIAKGVQIAVEVRDKFWSDHTELHTVRRRPLVAGNVGPYGACQGDCSEYTGVYVDARTKEELEIWHRPRVKTLLEAGVDLIAIDTIPAQAEAEALAHLLTEFPTCKAWLSFSCKDGAHLCHGEKLVDAVTSISYCQQIFGVGINCTPPEHVEPLLASLQGHTGDKVLVVYPNSGETWTTDKTWEGGESCRKLHEYVPAWWALGVRWVGGCCRIGPEEITRIRQAVDALSPGALIQ